MFKNIYGAGRYSYYYKLNSLYIKMNQSFPLFHFVILVVLLILFTITFSLYFINPVQINEEISNNTVIRVIDGDTFEIYSGESVRLICIDTPEKGEGGYDLAKEFLEGLVLDKEVRLEKDVSETDKYGRLLRYVWVDEVFVNKEIVKEGYGEVFEYGDDTKYCGVIGG